MFEEVISLENLFNAWREFKRGKMNKSDVRLFSLNIEENIFLLHEQLQNDDWHHQVYQPFLVSDPKLRLIHKASVSDRIIHRALVRVIEPYFEKVMVPHSWSCRKGKGVLASVNNVHRQLENISRHGTKKVWVLHGDIRKYFASIDHDILLSIITKYISDSKVINLIKIVINSHEVGLPLGNSTSQLFANLYATSIDRFILENILPQGHARYCDDFLLIDCDYDRLSNSINRIKLMLEIVLKLQLHPSKTNITPYNHGIDWLGVRLFPGGGRRIRRVSSRRALRQIHNTVKGVLSGMVSDDHWRAISASYYGVFKRSFCSKEQESILLLQKII